MIYLGCVRCAFSCSLFLPSDCAVVGLYPDQTDCVGEVVVVVLVAVVVANKVSW